MSSALRHSLERSLTVGMVVVLSLAVVPDRVRASQSPGQNLTVERTNGAISPEEHLALATKYRRQAAKYEQRVKYHEEMAELYKQHPLPFDGKLPYGMQMQNHCKYFAESYRRKAHRALEIARSHEEQSGTKD